MRNLYEIDQAFCGSSDDAAAHTHATVLLALEVTDPEVVTELQKYPDGPKREQFALSALRLGSLALRQATGEVDASTVRDAGEKLLHSLAELLAKRGTEISGEISSALRQYFDPASGALPQRIEALLRNDGELDRALRAHLGLQNSTIAQTIAAHLGEGSQIFKLLSPTDANGIGAQIEHVLESALGQQQALFLKEFSLDNKESALSRLVDELTTNNGNLKTDLKTQVEGLVGEFSLDKPGSALSRLVSKVEKTQKAIADEFSTDNDQSAINRLSRMLSDTRQQIDKNLTLDNEGSALARLKRELQTAIDALNNRNMEFQSEVRSTLAALEARKEEASHSTRHGKTFEDQLGLVLAAEAQRINDSYEATGNSKGAIKSCKIGDFVTVLGSDSAAPGARVVWEAKNDKSYDLKSALAEIEQARKNRQAQVGVFVFASEAAPVNLQPFSRYGNDLVITWNPEDVTSDLYVKVAFSVGRALVIRENQSSLQTSEAVQSIELACRTIEKQLKHLDDIKTWAETVRNNGERIAGSAGRMRADLAKEIQTLDDQVTALRLNHDPTGAK
ncbi:MAG: hypothetical protein ACJ746_18945 [Bryobacteraceae bacterium]